MSTIELRLARKKRVYPSNPLTGLDGVRALRSLSGQHDTVRAIKDSISNVTDFRTSRTRVVLVALSVNNSAPQKKPYQLTVIDSSICVAQMTGFPTLLHLAIIIF